MKKILIYDLPTRIFHWLFAGLFMISFIIAKTIDDELPLYSYHMILGFILAASVILRTFWGLFGSTYARFTSFELNPGKLLNYLKKALTSKTEKSLGHNPASSYAAIFMMIFALGLAFSGYQMVEKNNKEFYEEIHELFAHLFLFTAILHVIGIALHTIKHKDPIGLSMLHGKKITTKNQTGISHQHTLAAIIFVFIIAALSINLFKNYDSTTGTLTFMEKSLALGEQKKEKEND